MPEPPPSGPSEAQLESLARTAMNRAADLLMDIRDAPTRPDRTALLESVATTLGRVRVTIDMLAETPLREDLENRHADLHDLYERFRMRFNAT